MASEDPNINPFAGKPLSERPLHQVQAVALANPEAAAEWSRRYAADRRYGPSYSTRLAKAWLQGFNGEPNPFEQYRSGADNYARPLSRAHSHGAAARREAEGWAAQ